MQKSVASEDVIQNYLDSLYVISHSGSTVHIYRSAINHFKKFVQKINDNCSEDIAELISISGPKNLRKIKRLINLASYRSSIGNDTPKKFDLSIMWSLFEYLIENNTKAARFYEYLPKETGHSFLKYIAEIIPSLIILYKITKS